MMLLTVLANTVTRYPRFGISARPLLFARMESNSSKPGHGRELKFGKIRDVTPTSATVTVSGSGSCFNNYSYHTRALTPWVILELFDAGLMTLRNQRQHTKFIYTKLHDEDRDHSLKINSCTLTMTEQFHKKSNDIDWFDLKTSVERAAGDQLLLQQTISDSVTSQSFGTFSTVMSYLNVAGNRTSLPSFGHDNASHSRHEGSKVHIFEDETNLEAIEEYSSRADGFLFHEQVKHHDLDHNGHALVSAYVRYCHNAKIASAIARGVLDKKELYSTPCAIKSLKCRLLGDSCYGDALEVTIWNIGGHENSQLFKVHNRTQGMDMFHATIEFFPSKKVFDAGDAHEMLQFLDDQQKIGGLKFTNTSKAQEIIMQGSCAGISKLGHFSCYTGNALVWQIQDIFAWRRYIFFFHACNYVQLRQESLIFVIVMKMHLSKSFYTKARQGMLANLTTRHAVLNVGRSSVDTRCSMVVDGCDVATYVERAVFVDAKTRKPSQAIAKLLPESFGDHKSHSPPKYLRPFEIPEKFYSSKYNVTACDIDQNHHVTHYVYVQACMETAFKGIHEGQLKELHIDREQFAVRELSVLFADEASFGETFDVSAWVNPTGKDELCFVIKQRGKNLFYATIQFYDNFENDEDIIISRL